MTEPFMRGRWKERDRCEGTPVKIPSRGRSIHFERLLYFFAKMPFSARIPLV